MNIEKADKKQIEEIAQIINGSTELDTIAYYRCMNIAKTLYNAGYRKIPEDSVVLSSEEFEKLKYTWITDSDAYKKGCKETAEKILNAQYQECKIAEQDVLKARGGNKNDNYYKGFSLGMTNTKMDIQELARQFGVEIKEL